MFTGIIEEVGRVQRISANRVYVRASLLTNSEIGDSVALNGICLTLVEKLPAEIYGFDFMEETRRRTTIKYWQPGQYVNIERALPANGRFDGHIVQGHVDAIGRIMEKREDWIKIQCPNEALDYIVPKGSVAIDGISLTVIDVKPDFFTVGIIPHTLKNTNLAYITPNTYVNIETDILARYIKKFLSQR